MVEYKLISSACFRMAVLLCSIIVMVSICSQGYGTEIFLGRYSASISHGKIGIMSIRYTAPADEREFCPPFRVFGRTGKPDWQKQFSLPDLHKFANVRSDGWIVRISLLYFLLGILVLVSVHYVVSKSIWTSVRAREDSARCLVSIPSKWHNKLSLICGTSMAFLLLGSWLVEESWIWGWLYQMLSVPYFYGLLPFVCLLVFNKIGIRFSWKANSLLTLSMYGIFLLSYLPKLVPFWHLWEPPRLSAPFGNAMLLAISGIFLGPLAGFIANGPKCETGGEERCRSCGYLLRGNVSVACPECGTPIKLSSDDSL